MSPCIDTPAQVEVRRLQAENAQLRQQLLEAGLREKSREDARLAAAEFALGPAFRNGVDVPKLQRLLSAADATIQDLQRQVEQLRSLPERKDVRELLDDLARKDARIAALERECGCGPGLAGGARDNPTPGPPEDFPRRAKP